MLFTLEVLKAREGDCLLLHWGTRAQPKLAVIDGGPGMVYETFLRPRLEQIRSARGGGQLAIEFVMVSHVDNDHIVGVKKLFSKLKDEVQSNDPDKPFHVERLWHNTFDDIIGNALNTHYNQFSASFEASASGEPRPDTVDTLAQALVARSSAPPAQARHIAEDIALILAGHPEGRKLRDDQRFLFQQNQIQGLNKPFANTLITGDLTPHPLPFLGLEITIVGPLQAEIDALQAGFDEYLQKHSLHTGEAALAAYADTSVPNLSSIVCLVRSGTKTMLLTGDARGDRILAGLENAGLLGAGPAASLHVDLLKVPHHGSDRNVAPDFFRKVTADTYVFSGDGKHGNPERDTIEWVIDAHAKSDAFTMVFTYLIDDIDAKRKSEASHWNSETDPLRVLLDQKRAAGYSFELREDSPIAVELGSEHLDH